MATPATTQGKARWLVWHGRLRFALLLALLAFAATVPVVGSRTASLAEAEDWTHTVWIAGWKLPDWLGLVAPWLWITATFLLATGPQPRWATRWAWFWTFVSPLAVVGIPLFALMAGPPPWRQVAHRPGRRLTGGWAFLLVSLIVVVFDLNG